MLAMTAKPRGAPRHTTGPNMQRLYAADDPIFVGYLKTLLEDAGIPAIVRNEHLIGATGELPPHECWPELWVLDDADETAARRIVTAALAAPAETEAWRCGHCGEHLEPQFNACWRCGALRR